MVKTGKFQGSMTARTGKKVDEAERMTIAMGQSKRVKVVLKKIKCPHTI